MSTAVLGSDTNPGGRTYNEDRVETAHLTTRSGKTLSVAVLADGVGGEARGERASQLAIDTFMAVMRHAEGSAVLDMIVLAVKQANLAVFAEARHLGEEGRMATTMVVAVADAENTLYIANAGDSRIYFCRDGKLVQLTRDHSFENVMVWMGKLTPEQAAANPEAGKVMRVLGIREDIQVDVGMYQTTTEYGPANHIGHEGLKLKQGDSVLLCSDGLIKHTPATHTTLITLDDAARILSTQEGDKAAHAIMSRVLGRIPVGEQVDNISLAVLQVPDPGRSVNLAELHRAEALATEREARRKMVLAGATVGVPLALLLIISLVAFGAYYTYNHAGESATGTAMAQVLAAALTRPAVTAAASVPASATAEASETNTRPAPSATTAPPTLAPLASSSEVAELFNGETSLGPINSSSRQLISVPDGESRYLTVNYLRNQPGGSSVSTDGHVYLGGGSTAQLGLVNDTQFQLDVLPGSDVFVQTGPYAQGVEVDVADSQLVAVAKGCLALHFISANNLSLNCYGGQCSYSTRLGGDLVPVDAGSQVTIQVGQAAGSGPAPIPLADHARFWQLLSPTASGVDDAKLCQLPNAPATQQSRLQTAIAITQAAPTATPSPTSTLVPVGPPEATSTP
jgi:serine/threonine protein phosphatase PrpC